MDAQLVRFGMICALFGFMAGVFASIGMWWIRVKDACTEYLNKHAPGLKKEASLVDGAIVWPVPGPNDSALAAVSKFYPELLAQVALRNLPVVFSSDITKPTLHLPCKPECKTE